MHLVVTLYSLLILLSTVTASFSIHAYAGCPSNRSHKPLIMPIVCSIGWFLVSIDQLIRATSPSMAPANTEALVLLTIATLAALLYFVVHYLRERHILCHAHHSE